MAGEGSADAGRYSRRARPRDEASFTRNLRFELADEEGRALLGSWVVSAFLGLVWLLLVIFGPTTDISHLLPPEERPISVTFEPPPPPDVPVKPEATQPVPAAAKTAAPAVGKPKPSAEEVAAKRAAAASAAFGAAPAANGPVGDVSNVLRGVDVASGAPKPGAAVGKSVLAYGQGGQGVRTPGRADMGGGAGVGNLGGVVGGGGIGHEGVTVAAPKAIRRMLPGLGGPIAGHGRAGHRGAEPRFAAPVLLR